MLVQEYSSHKLTRASDKLVALSGIAQTMGAMVSI